MLRTVLGEYSTLVLFVEKSMTSVGAVIDLRPELLQHGPPLCKICNVLTAKW